MPKGSRVHRCFVKVKAKGASPGKAARICQASTGESLSSGKKIRKKGRK